MPTNIADKQEIAKQFLAQYGNNLDEAFAALKAAKSAQQKARTVKHTYGETLIKLEHVNKIYKLGKNEVAALTDANLEIKAGEYVSITGPSGSGKSTLLQLIGALDKPTSGEISIGGQSVATLNDRKLSELRNKTIGFIFQFFYLQPFLSLQDNLEVPSMFAHIPKQERINQRTTLAEKVGLVDRLSHLPKELSGGQMQRAAIARALMNKPKILLADEPTGNLDRKNAAAIMDLLEDIRSVFGTTIITVTHDHEMASRADREISLLDGRIQ